MKDKIEQLIKHEVEMVLAEVAQEAMHLGYSQARGKTKGML